MCVCVTHSVVRCRERIPRTVEGLVASTVLTSRFHLGVAVHPVHNRFTITFDLQSRPLSSHRTSRGGQAGRLVPQSAWSHRVPFSSPLKLRSCWLPAKELSPPPTIQETSFAQVALISKQEMKISPGPYPDPNPRRINCHRFCLSSKAESHNLKLSRQQQQLQKTCTKRWIKGNISALEPKWWCVVCGVWCVVCVVCVCVCVVLCVVCCVLCVVCCVLCCVFAKAETLECALFWALGQPNEIRRLLGRWGFTRQPENSKRAHLMAPVKHHQKTTRRPWENKKSENGAGEGKKAHNFGPPTLRGPHLRGPPPFEAAQKTLNLATKWICQKWIGQKWIGQKWSNKDGQKRIGQKRSQPKFFAYLDDWYLWINSSTSTDFFLTSLQPPNQQTPLCSRPNHRYGKVPASLLRRNWIPRHGHTHHQLHGWTSTNPWKQWTELCCFGWADQRGKNNTTLSEDCHHTCRLYVQTVDDLLSIASRHVLRMSFVPEQKNQNFDKQKIVTFWSRFMNRDVAFPLFFLLLKLGGLGVVFVVQRHAAATWRAWQSIIPTLMATTQSPSGVQSHSWSSSRLLCPVLMFVIKLHTHVTVNTRGLLEVPRRKSIRCMHLRWPWNCAKKERLAWGWHAGWWSTIRAKIMTPHDFLSSELIATFTVARSTLQTRKLWLVNVTTDYHARYLGPARM